MARKKQQRWWISGLPIESKLKVLLTLSLFVFGLFNHLLPTLFNFDYAGRNVISVIFIFSSVLFSFGSYLAEMIVIGIGFYVLLSSAWDLSMLDGSAEIRKIFLISSLLILGLETIFGRISILNLFGVMRRSLGMKK